MIRSRDTCRRPAPHCGGLSGRTAVWRRVLPAAALAFACTVLAAAADRMAFVDVASRAGLRLLDVSGSTTKDYIIEAIGHGAALFDYDNDGDLDALIVTGSTLERLGKGGDPMVAFYRNDGTGQFTDVTVEAGFDRHGWGNGVCVADYDNDGFEDVYITAFGPNVLWRNTGKGRFEDMTRNSPDNQWSTGCAFGDYDRDGHVDLYVANFLDFDPAAVPPRGANADCRFLNIETFCGPLPLQGQTDVLYRNNGNGTFQEVTRRAGITDPGYYGFGVIFSDIDNDGWPDIYVANDSVPNLLFRNAGDGTFIDDGLVSGVALSGDGRSQAGMGVDAADYDRDGDFDLVVTNFSHDYTTLYENNGRGEFTDASFTSNVASTMGPYLGWGVDFADMDNDGLVDIFIANGHVYPDVGRTGSNTPYLQLNQLFRNAGGRRFRHVTAEVGGALMLEKSSRGSASGDIDNDGDVDVLVVNIDDRPTLLRNDRDGGNHWIMFRLVGTRSNRSGIGARVRVTTGDVHQMDEVRGGGSYMSQNDRRVHFGLGAASQVDRVEIRWPSGVVQTLTDVEANRIHVITEEGEIETAQ